MSDGSAGDDGSHRRLRLVGDDENDGHVVAAHPLPLGPWAGATVELWTTSSGQTWHSDPDCPGLTSRGRSASYRQPDHGGLDQIVLPERVHCYPTGPLRAYRSA